MMVYLLIIIVIYIEEAIKVIINNGGIQILIDLFNMNNPTIREKATNTLLELSKSDFNLLEIIRRGGIKVSSTLWANGNHNLKINLFELIKRMDYQSI